MCLSPFDFEKNGMVRAWHGRGMANVNQTRPHCVNRMGKTHSKPLAARHGHGMVCVNPPLSAMFLHRGNSFVGAKISPNTYEVELHTSQNDR
jgi:hypothetical protein